MAFARADRTGTKPARIETCLFHASKLWHVNGRPAGPALDAGRCQRKARLAYPCGLAQRLITQARTLFDEELGLDLICPIPSTPWTRRPSLCACRSFRGRTSAPPMKITRCSTCGATFRVGLGWQAARRSCASICSCRKPEPSTSWIVATSTLPAPLCVAPSRGLLRHACQASNIDRSSRLFGADGSLDRHHLRPDHLPGRLLHPSGLPRTSAAHPLQGPRVRHLESWSSSPTTSRFEGGRWISICALYKSRWQVELFFKWIKQHLRIKQFYGTSENAVKTQIWIAVSVYVLVAIVKKRLDLDVGSTLCYRSSG